MAETELTAAQCAALDGTTDSLTSLKYLTRGENYPDEGQRVIHRLKVLGEALGNKFRVYKDGAATFGVRAGKLDDGDTTYTYAGSTANDLTSSPWADNSTCYIWLYLLSGSLTLTGNTSGFPDPSTTPHIPLGTIAIASGAYAYTDITDLRQQAVFALLSGATAANANTLTDASNADALHTHTTFATMPIIPTATVAAAGSTQSDAAAIATGFTLVSAADAAKGVKLPTAAAGLVCIVKNNVAAVLKIWPNTDDAINAIAANANDTLAASTAAIYIAYNATTWYSIPLLPS